MSIDTLSELQNFGTTYYTPPVPAAVRVFAKVMGHERDLVDRIDVEDGTVRIKFRWSVRCCEQDEEYDVPLSVLTAPDVAGATERWKLTCDLREAESKLEERRRDVIRSEQRVAELLKAIGMLDAQPETSGNGE